MSDFWKFRQLRELRSILPGSLEKISHLLFPILVLWSIADLQNTRCLLQAPWIYAQKCVMSKNKAYLIYRTMVLPVILVALWLILIYVRSHNTSRQSYIHTTHQIEQNCSTKIRGENNHTVKLLAVSFRDVTITWTSFSLFVHKWFHNPLGKCRWMESIMVY